LKSPFRAVFIFCIFLAVLATALFASKGINPFEMNLNIFHLKPLTSASPSSTVVPSPNLQSQIVITNKDLQKVVSSAASEYLTNPVVTIGKTDISASADVKKIIKTHADMIIKISFNSGKVRADITDLKTGSLGAPSVLKMNLTNLINSKLDSEINKKYTISNISQETGKIIVTVNS
jgi:hypothetical protein